MATLLIRNVASMTEMREPHKVLEKSGGEPVAVLKTQPSSVFSCPLRRSPKSNIARRN